VGDVGDVLVRGGTIIDGTGGPSRPGDVRVRDGVIVEIGESLEPAGEQVIDATGAFVTPGLIDSHTHYDLEMFWDPSLDPLPSYGMTTIIMGNCGLGIAPVRDDVKTDVADLLCFIEELPPTLAGEYVPWSWKTWSEYHAVASQTALTVQPFAYVAHNAIRATVMGHDAWERAATTEEIAEMVALLDDALAAGSLGMSTNWFDTDRNRKLVPSRLCNDAELDALLDVIARYPHATFQVIARAATDRRRALEKACARGIRCLSLGDGVGGAKKEEGLDIWHLGGGNQPFQPMLGFEASIAAAAVPPWHEMINGPADDKLRKLADPEWRAAAREAWDNPLPEQNSFRAEQLDIFILSDSENGTGPVDISLKDLAEQRGVHPSDALADWVLANGIGSRYTKLSSTVVPLTDDQRREMMTASLHDPFAIVGGTDAGAHLTMFCGAGSNLYLLTHWARDEEAVSIEQAIHCMTQRSAEFFSLHDRGVIEVGKRADLAVFALDEIETRGFERRYDLPNDKYRLSRPSAGFRAVTVAGVPTVLDGKPTESRPTQLGNALSAASA
jgi:N-acyl-D-amino-acid deacylase